MIPLCACANAKELWRKQFVRLNAQILFIFLYKGAVRNR